MVKLIGIYSKWSTDGFNIFLFLDPAAILFLIYGKKGKR